MSGTVSYHAGFVAEDLVARDYERRAVAVAFRRWRGQSGEIDLILRDQGTVVFVEVKKSKNFERAALRLSARQRARILNAATEFLSDEPNGQLTDVRFDLAMVDATGAVNVIENAFI